MRVRSGKLAAYVNNAVGVYKCPSDGSLAQNGPRLRSVSMNALVGDPMVRANRFNPNWCQFLKTSQFPGPANFFVLIEEHPDTINDGYFVNTWDQVKWGNLPASFHRGSANITWGDGHIERHRWLPDTVRPPVKGAAGGGFVPTNERESGGERGAKALTQGAVKSKTRKPKREIRISARAKMRIGLGLYRGGAELSGRFSFLLERGGDGFPS
jgi:prepilin-type processing-associated H-X9-DG protein